jgi:cytochrome d ubiquinol oxidase subunit II
MLAKIPMFFILVGLAAYIVLAGADFGAGFWTLVSAGRKAGGTAARDYMHRAMGPVWEANHVWLIFILVVCWTAYPVAFASMTSTLVVPLFIAAVGIILRGASYALRGQFEFLTGKRLVDDRVFALSSILTPFALGTAIGAIASGRVPVGNAAGDLFTSWLNPTSLLIGILLIATSSYLAAVYLAADALRFHDQELVHVFRSRALWAGLVAGALAIIGLLVLRLDSRAIWDGLTTKGVYLLGLSVVAGLATLVLVWRYSFSLARFSSAVAVGAIVAGWAIAQRPHFLQDLTVREAAAGPSTMLAVVICVTLGAIVLIPSLALLFSLFLKGQLDGGSDGEVLPTEVVRKPECHQWPLRGFVIATFVLGTGGTILSSGWVQFLSICFLCAFAVSAFFLAASSEDLDQAPVSRPLRSAWWTSP